ncbi:flagellar hook-length control protein [Parageobacillus genomosp. 1]|uniref:Flagellar hook-length control protein n=1 Tax=Parageobacillus genomosp. 1 TaxID=1295642 RepID=A0ABC9VHE2_9BACL|nr:flagellar hook-length control protein FliK [Parageobacillus genomosp. 1]EZP78042.1 flagellar hook-length control protein [Parageobacillus genomosp. 1]
MKVAANYPPLGQSMAGSAEKPAAKLAGKEGEWSPFQQLLAIAKADAKDKAENAALSGKHSLSSAEGEKGAVRQSEMEEWTAYLLFLLNGMLEAKEADFFPSFPSDANHHIRNKEMIASFIQQINNSTDPNALMKQIRSIITDELALDKDLFQPLLQNGIMEEESYAYTFRPSTISLLQNGIMEESEGKKDVQAVWQEWLKTFLEQEKKGEGVSYHSRKLERPLSQHPFSFSSNDISSSITVAGNVERKNFTQLFPMLPLNGTMVAPQENIPVITVEQTLPEQKASESFLQRLANVFQSGRFTRFQNGNAQLVIRLYPEHLGTLTVKMVREQGGLTAKLIVSTDSAKALLDANLPQLYQILDTQHIAVEKWNVWTEHHYTPRFYQGEQEQGQKQQQQRKEEKPKKQPLSHFTVEMLDAEA